MGGVVLDRPQCCVAWPYSGFLVLGALDALLMEGTSLFVDRFEGELNHLGITPTLGERLLEETARLPDEIGKLFRLRAKS
jgi:hypothetical protein